MGKRRRLYGIRRHTRLIGIGNMATQKRSLISKARYLYAPLGIEGRGPLSIRCSEEKNFYAKSIYFGLNPRQRIASVPTVISTLRVPPWGRFFKRRHRSASSPTLITAVDGPQDTTPSCRPRGFSKVNCFPHHPWRLAMKRKGEEKSIGSRRSVAESAHR